MRKIVIAFWRGDNPTFESLLEIKNNTVLKYTPENLNKLVVRVIECNLNIQIVHTTGGFIAWVDDGRFRQM